MIKSLQELVNCMGPEYFHDDPHNRKDSTGKPLRVLKDVTLVYQKLNELQIPYKWQAVTGGFSPSGAPFFIGNLTVTVGGHEYTVPGTAQAQSPGMEISGQSTTALQNAFLRGLRAAEYLYQGLSVPPSTNNTSEPSVPNTAPPQAALSQTQTITQVSTTPQTTGTTTEAPKRTYQKRNAFAGSKTGGSTTKKDYPEWDGSVKFKSGKFAGKEFRDPVVTDEYLTKLATMDQPLETAKKELNRRLAERGLPSLNVDDGDVY